MVDRDSTSLETGSKTRDPSGVTPSSHWQTSSAPPLLPLRRGSIGNPSATGSASWFASQRPTWQERRQTRVDSERVWRGRGDPRRTLTPCEYAPERECESARLILPGIRFYLQADKRKQGEDDADTSTPRMRRKSVDLNSEQSADRMGTQNRRVSGLLAQPTGNH